MADSQPNIKRRDQRTMTEALMRKGKFTLFGLNLDDIIKYFFAGNAWIAIVVLGLITFSLFREGADFFGQHYQSLLLYRKAGLEYVDIFRDKMEAYGQMRRYVEAMRSAEEKALAASDLPASKKEAEMARFNQFSRDFDEASVPLEDLLQEMTRMAAGIKDQQKIFDDMTQARKILLDAGQQEAADEIELIPVDYDSQIAELRAFFPQYLALAKDFEIRLTQILREIPQSSFPNVNERAAKLKKTIEAFLKGMPSVAANMKAWDPNKPVPFYESFTKFIFGTKWTTQSFWQDWYGIVPLLVGSVSISVVAIAVSVPFGVGAAIYVNQVATPAEQNFIKPYIEFISAIPSVVLGFFGVVVLGTTLREISQIEWLSWFPGFPFSERLNILTAGLLLALMAVPTIFTLSEDAINNVPRAFKEASFALGATRFQTVIRIIVPAALSGIISAILLGFGRVIGETMVVLLCAGNRIQIPDFSEGLAFIVQPVHTMTGLIAQEIPEVAKGDLQYRALFMLAIILFIIALGINYFAQYIVRKFKISIG